MQTPPIKVALVTDNEHIIEILEAYVAAAEADVEVANMETQIIACEADARKWVWA